MYFECGESIPSKDVYVFFILRRRVQRYRTAVRDAKNKKYIHRRHKSLCVCKSKYNIYHRADKNYSFSRKYVASISAVERAKARGYISNALPTLFFSSLPEKPI